jgi:hypothetical protein
MKSRDSGAEIPAASQGIIFGGDASTGASMRCLPHMGTKFSGLYFAQNNQLTGFI